MLVGGLVAATTALGLAGATAGPAWAATTCANMTITGTVYTDVIVPAGTWCVLHNATVYGNVVANPGSGLQIGNTLSADHSAIYGSILSNPTMGAFDTFGTVAVSGSVQLNGLSTTPAAVIPGNSDGLSYVEGITISGPLSVTNAQAGAVGVGVDSDALSGAVAFTDNNLPSSGGAIFSDTVYSSIRVTNNTGGGQLGFSTVGSGNTVYGSVTCGGNAPPWAASNNTVYSTNGAAGGTC
ncbi:MAG: hypothetical protein JO265_04695 [Acidimicrobiia bacterium]|nr:hypothetical protein [Acidimicrobiia bacterium]